MMGTRESAQWYFHERGIFTVPIPPGKKGSVTPHWNELRISKPEEFAKYFNGERQNLGILTGIDGLCDIDIDSEEAWWSWIEYGITTGMKWGHGELAPTHFIYRADQSLVSIKYIDPATDEAGEATLIELRCQDRAGKCLQTVAPPSVHPSGEAVEFCGSPGFPAKVERDDLQKRVRLTAVASMLGRHIREGVAHQVFIALAGALKRAEWALAEAQRLVRAIFRVKWREEADLRAANTEVESTYRHFDEGGDTTGLRTLSNLIDERVFKRAKHLLGLDSQEEWMYQQPPPQRAPRVLPESEPIENLRHRVITRPRVLIAEYISTPSITLLVAPGKVGKTVFAIQMAMSLANGLHLFGNYTTQTAAGLIVEWDDQQGEASLQDFLLKSRASRPEQPLDIVLRPKEPLTIADPEFRPWLTAQIQKRPAQFCVLDSLTALRGFGSDDKSKNVVKLEAGEILMLGEIAIETNCAILLVHHDSKTASTLDLFSRAAGTFALQACSDTQIVLGRFRELAVNDPARLVSVRGRHLEGLQAVVHFCADTLDYDFILEGAAAPLYPELCRLLRAFRAETFDNKKVQEKTGWSRSKAYDVLSALTMAGVLNHNSDTKEWSWSPSWQSTLDEI